MSRCMINIKIDGIILEKHVPEFAANSSRGPFPKKYEGKTSTAFVR